MPSSVVFFSLFKEIDHIYMVTLGTDVIIALIVVAVVVVIIVVVIVVRLEFLFHLNRFFMELFRFVVYVGNVNNARGGRDVKLMHVKTRDMNNN